MTSVYILEVGSYDSRFVEGAFRSAEAAMAAHAALLKVSSENWQHKDDVWWRDDLGFDGTGEIRKFEVRDA